MRTHRRSVVFFLAMLVLGGAVSSLSLPVALFPYVEFPRIVISLDAGDRPADRMAAEFTIPVEEAVRPIPGLNDMRSTSSRGSSEIAVNFAWGQDMVAALLEVQAAVNQVLPSLPSGAAYSVRRMDPTVFPTIAYSLTSDTHSQVELHDIAYFQIRPILTTVTGVAKVAVLGGQQAEYRVTIDPAQLRARGLALDDVALALSAAGTISAVGRLEDNYKLYLGIVDNQLADERRLGEVVLRKGRGDLVRIKDIATVAMSTVPAWTRVAADGRSAVIFQVYQQPAANTVQIGKDVQARLAQLTLPGGVKVANWYDQSQLILASAGSVRDAVIIGIVLAGIVLLVFLRNWRITLIAMAAVPASLAATILLLKAMHSSFNIMTLGGMAAAVGLIIDDAIVMVEHIMRRTHAEKTERTDIWGAVREFTRPLVGSSLSTIVIFAPLAFLSGVTGAFFKALSLTMASSLCLSFLIAWLAVPIMADAFLRDAAEGKPPGRLAQKIDRGYRSVLGRTFARPWLLVVPLAPLLIFAWLGYKNVGSGFMPTMDEGGFIIDYRSPPGTSLTETDRLLGQLETIVQSTPEVDTYSRRTGLGLGGNLQEANGGDFFVRLKSGKRRPIDAVMADVLARAGQKVPGLQLEMAQLMEDLIGDLTAVPQPIELQLYCDDGVLLRSTAARVADAIRQVTGVVSVKSGVVLAGDAITINVDSARASLEGMTADEVTRDLSNLMSGVTAANKILQGQKLVGIRVWIPPASRRTVGEVGRLEIRAPDGHYFPASRVATIATVTGQPQITRGNLKQMVAVTGRLSGRDLGSTIADIKARLSQPNALPKGVTYVIGGTYAQQQSAFAGLIAVFVAAVALVYLLLLFLYESFRISLLMLLCTLLTLTGVTIGLWTTHTELNISSMMGMTMIVGIATEVSIFYVSELVSLPAGRDRHEALIEAGLNRMRPIAMTTFAAILALAPLALGLGTGSAMQQPLAIAIISGLVLQFPVVLLVLPVLLSLGTRQERAADHTS